MPDAVTSSDSGINALVQKLLAASMAKPVSPMAQAPAAAQPKQSSGMSPLALPMAAMAGEQALTSKVDPNPKYKGGAELGNVAGSVAGNYFGGPIGGALGGMAGKFLGGEIGAKKMALLGVLEDGTDRVPQTGPYMLHEGEAVVPADQNPANGGGVSGQKAQLDALVKSLMQRAGAPQPGGMVKPTPRSSPESMQQTGYRTQTFQGNSKGAKMADAGEAISNFGSFVHNAVAQHKQNQVRDAMAEWQGFDQALEKAQVLAGDPSDPKYKENVQKYLAADPFVKANLDPSNPKAVKRLKNMYKALNVDLLDGDAENVHRKGLQQMFKAKTAFQKVQDAKAKQEQYKQGQGGGQQQPQQVDPAKRQGQMNESIQKLMNQGTVQRADPKQAEEAARIGVELRKAEEASKNLDTKWYETKTAEDGHAPTAAEIEAHQQNKALKPIDQHIQKAMDAAEAGDWKTADAEFKIAHQGSESKRISPPNVWELIQKANAGDPAAKQALAKDVAMRKEIAGAYGAGRAMYNMGNYINQQGEIATMSALDAATKIRQGLQWTLIGGLGSQQLVQMQRLQTEGYPAAAAVREYTKAFDNPSDRRIFARVMANPPQDEDGFIPWAKASMDQALKSSGELSPDGRKLVVRMKRLADTMGTLRSALGLPSTEASIHLMMQLMPGANTPDSAMANDIMDQLEATMQNAVDIPMYKKMKANPKVMSGSDPIPNANQ
jgi:hypothetical protein